MKLGLFTSLDIIYIAIQLTTIKEQQKKKIIVFKSTKIQSGKIKRIRQQDNNHNGFNTGKTVVILRKRR